MKRINPDIENQAIGLPQEDRARLALALIESLDQGKDEDVAELWLDESERRLAAYDAGASPCREAEASLLEIERAPIK